MQGHPAKTACQREPSVRSCTSGRQFLRRSVTLNKSVRFFCALLLSPSMRRVWIEICILPCCEHNHSCHPPCGGCGLKLVNVLKYGFINMSPSMRRVWIEIHACWRLPVWFVQSPSMRRVWIEIALYVFKLGNNLVSPSMRRVWIEIVPAPAVLPAPSRHPPCGGCGLKFDDDGEHKIPLSVTLHAEGVD